MTDNVIEFKPKNTENVDVYFGSTSNYTIVNDSVTECTCPKEYLKECKRLLEQEDYHDVLCGIVDIDIYYELDRDLQKIIETYYTYTGTDLKR